MPTFVHSIRFRLTCWYSAILAVALIGFSGILYGFVRYQSLHHHDDSLRSVAADVVSILSRQPDCVHLTPGQMSDLGRLDRLVLLHELEGMGQVFYHSPGLDPAFLPRTEAEVQQLLSEPESFRTVKTPGRMLRVYSLRYRTQSGRLGAVRVVDSLGNLEESFGTLRWSLFFLIPLSMLIAGSGGYWLANRALRPVDHLIRLAREIEATNLSRRLPAPRTQDELGRLVDTFNQMISRLEGAFELMRRFTADASHQLQTPLTVMRSTVEVAIERPRTPENYRRILADIHEEILRMSRLVGDLLLLARADAGSLEFQRGAIQLDELIAEAVDAMRPLAEARGVDLRLDLHEKLRIAGDERWLREMLHNLIDNAIKYTTTPGEVRVALARRDEMAVLQVMDDGPGVPPGEQIRVFERFYRSTTSSNGSAGAGLGLSIALWIARSHGGDIRVQSRQGNESTFEVTLPISEPLTTSQRQE